MRGGDHSGHNLVLSIVTINLNVLRMLMKSRIANDEEVTSNICAIVGSGYTISLVTCIPSIRVGFDTEMTMSSIDEPSSWDSLHVC